MATVTIVFRKDKFNKKEEAPIHFRIIKNRKSSYIASGIMIPKDHWDEKNNKVKSNHRNSARLNSYLSNKFTEIQDTVFEHETISKSLTSRTLRDKVFGKKPTCYLRSELLFCPKASQSKPPKPAKPFKPFQNQNFINNEKINLHSAFCLFRLANFRPTLERRQQR